jgi:molybdate transport system substrate-binding protein
MKNVIAASAIIGLAFMGSAEADEIRVLSSNILKAVMDELAPQFERSSGHALAITWGTSEGLKKDIENGAQADIVILTRGRG